MPITVTLCVQNINISEYSKLTLKEYKNKHDLMRKVIHWELCKRMKFDLADKWYMHKPESIIENEMHGIIWDFEIQTDLPIHVTRPDFILINKKG